MSSSAPSPTASCSPTRRSTTSSPTNCWRSCSPTCAEAPLHVARHEGCRGSSPQCRVWAASVPSPAMQTLNDWLPPWPPPAPDAPISEQRQLPRGVVMTHIFKRTMVLAMLGGTGIGGLWVLPAGWVALIAIPFGAIVGFPLAIVAGCVLALVGGFPLVPYRGPVVAMTVV